jgi:Fe-S cluster assembly protein SufD
MSGNRCEDARVTAAIPRIKTPAEAGLASAFAAMGAGSMRQKAFARFEEAGLPTRRVEAWHYTDLRAALREANPVAAELPVASTMPVGVRVRPMREALADASIVAKLFPAQGAEDAAVALNAAMAEEGLVVEIPAGAGIAAPIEIGWSAAGGAARSEYHRTLIVAGEGARATVVETHASGPGTQRSSAVVFYLAKGARVDHVFVASGHMAETHVASAIVEIGEGAAFASFAHVEGGGLLRRQCFARLSGENAKAAFRGVSLLGGKCHVDNTLVVDHAAPHGESRELFKHIVADEAVGVFQGKVVVRPGAQKVDGGMKSQALLLSDDAAMYNKPELEIFADDVVCGHGATVGELDRDQLFYLTARGLPPAEAEALLLEGFARDAYEFVEDEALRERLGGMASRWLARRSA